MLGDCGWCSFWQALSSDASPGKCEHGVGRTPRMGSYECSGSPRARPFYRIEAQVLFALCRQRHERQINAQVCSSTAYLPTSSLGKLTPHVLTIVLHNRHVSLHDNWIVAIDPTSGYVRSSPCLTGSVPADVHLAPLHLGRAQSSRWLEHEAGRARQTASLPGCSLATRDRRH